MSEAERDADDPRPVWLREENLSKSGGGGLMRGVLIALRWVAFAYLAIGCVMVLFLAMGILGLAQPTREAGQLFGLGMAAFFIGGVLLLLLRIDEKLGQLTKLGSE